MVFLGLARVSDDEVAAECCVGFSVPNGGDAVEESQTVTPPTHASQQGLRHVLKRQIEVRHARSKNRVSQLVAEVTRV